MNGLIVNLKLVYYNVMHHKVFALFCVFGTMLTFVFITIVAQVADILMNNTSPVMDAERIVSIPLVLLDDNGNPRKGLTRVDIQIITANLKEMSCHACYQSRSMDINVNGRSTDYGVCFVDINYWKVFQFEFVQGHPFTESEMHTPCVIVNEYFVEKFFPDRNVMNKEIEIQRLTYKIVGVVKNVSYFAQEGGASLWVPEQFNRYASTGYVFTYILFPRSLTSEMALSRTRNSFKLFAEMFGIKESETLKHIETVKESILRKYGGDFLVLGISSILFILLIIPILNIILLNIANVTARGNEAGLKRALGASRWNVFEYMFMENLLLVMIGTVLGIMLTFPVCHVLDEFLFSENIDGGTTVLSELNWRVIFTWVLPLSVLFSLLSGGFPIYRLVKRSIIDLLKGGAK